MTYEQYRLMFSASLAACIIFFLLTVILFFALRIPRAFGDITGLTRKKAIKNINKQNERAKISGSGGTDRISASGRIISEETGNTIITEKIETDRLGGIRETTVLSGSAGETAVLDGQNAGETILLTENMAPVSAETEPLEPETDDGGFAREIQSIVFIHTDEIIP